MMQRESTWSTGQMPGWRQRETNLMQLLTLLRRTCSLSEHSLERTKHHLISLADEANPIINKARFFAIMVRTRFVHRRGGALAESSRNLQMPRHARADRGALEVRRGCGLP
jgi:hypothetical protein